MTPIFCCLTTPLGYAIQAYQCTHLKGPHHRCAQSNPRQPIKKELQPFLDRMGIRKDLLMLEDSHIVGCMAQGTNHGLQGSAIIWVSQSLQKADPDACRWLIKHEISHIKHNDLLTIPIFSLMSSIVAAGMVSLQMMPLIPALCITISVGLIAQVLFTQYRERQADAFAIAESSFQELLGGRRLLMSVQASNAANRSTVWGKILFSPTGEERLDYFHPSLTSRLDKIQLEMNRRAKGG